MSTLLGIAIKPRKRAALLEVADAELSTARGLVGDCRGKPGPRQVTLLTHANWRAACAEVGVELPWTARRANLLVDDLALIDSVGTHIQLGEAVLEITGETDPCVRMDAAQPGLFSALKPDWRGGVCCRVVQGGRLVLGMAVTLAPLALRRKSRPED